MESIWTRETLRRLLGGIKSIDEKSREEARRRWNRLAKPIYGLGRMEEILCRIAGIQASPEICLRKPSTGISSPASSSALAGR